MLVIFADRDIPKSSQEAPKSPQDGFQSDQELSGRRFGAKKQLRVAQELVWYGASEDQKSLFP